MWTGRRIEGEYKYLGLLWKEMKDAHIKCEEKSINETVLMRHVWGEENSGKSGEKGYSTR